MLLNCGISPALLRHEAGVERKNTHPSFVVGLCKLQYYVLSLPFKPYFFFLHVQYHQAYVSEILQSSHRLRLCALYKFMNKEVFAYTLIDCFLGGFAKLR
jgi:hypothetical protein